MSQRPFYWALILLLLLVLVQARQCPLWCRYCLIKARKSSLCRHSRFCKQIRPYRISWFWFGVTLIISAGRAIWKDADQDSCSKRWHMEFNIAPGMQTNGINMIVSNIWLPGPSWWYISRDFDLPEMCLEHNVFCKILTDKNFSKNICAIIVDEAHCISQWGGDFWKLYALLEKLQAFFPPNVPFLATSATLPPLALRDVHSKLAIDPDTSFYLNLGNDRPNMAMFVQQINGLDDYEALWPAHSVEFPVPHGPPSLTIMLSTWATQGLAEVLL